MINLEERALAARRGVENAVARLKPCELEVQTHRLALAAGAICALAGLSILGGWTTSRSDDTNFVAVSDDTTNPDLAEGEASNKPSAHPPAGHSLVKGSRIQLVISEWVEASDQDS